jgi:hypothetical protein
MDTCECIACGGTAVYNPRDDWWSCRDCNFEWYSGPFGVRWIHLGKDWGVFERSNGSFVPEYTLAVLNEVPE